MTAPDRDLRGWAGPAAGLSFVAGVAGAALRASDPYPRPWATPSEVQTYFTGNRAAARASVAGQLASAGALALFTATVSQRARRDHRPAHARAARTTGALAAAPLRPPASGWPGGPDERDEQRWLRPLVPAPAQPEAPHVVPVRRHRRP